MVTKLNPYIGFKDNTRQAMEFYKTVFGGELTLSTYKEFGASQTVDDDEKIMHGALVVSDSLTIFAADMATRGEEYHSGTAISISLSGDNNDELSGYFEKLSQGGSVTVPLAKAGWGDTFGMLVDQFGIKWMVNITGTSN